ncbi:5-oxoprolinase subunit C family protein [Priestia flexa]|uniref:5-oxoprolinase subunit C family protein n=1 Tax=Priestia flexa TaxID=86664 RepID=UPI000953A68A|nr:biotin-dependent carboxyltransferase family protein [Priestia flexa]MBY6086066.1 biotin-dependent carboxyltransferase family protein [Priestia flexa]SIQ28412.1 antagonist of KipI [Priestia flexa]
MSVNIIRPGLLTTVQDLGRQGFQKEGIIVSGAMDVLALRIANLLVGNEEEKAALEITLMGPKIRFEEDTLIAITGGDLSPTIDGEPVKMWRPVFVSKGSMLAFGVPKSGCRAYLSISGSFIIDPVMGSLSTSLRPEVGGFKGRALQAGDQLFCHPKTKMGEVIRNRLLNKQTDKPFKQAFWTIHPDFLPRYEENPTISVIEGPEYAWFTKESKAVFFDTSYAVTPQSDRMGYRLQSESTILERTNKRELLSTAVTFGTIQVPSDGQPIILLADHQTTGGYPRIGQVASADFSTLAQIPPGKQLQFQKISLQAAQERFMKQERLLEHLKIMLRMKN